MVTKDPLQKSRKITLVIPVFNEADLIKTFLEQTNSALLPLKNDNFEFELMFVNDGSVDSTLEKLLEALQRDPRIKVIDLSRHFGKECALSAGLDEASGDAVVPMDIDLQDPPEVIPKLISKWLSGFDVVVAQRSDRSSDSFLKRGTARWFYKLHNLMAEPKIPEDVGDFQLLDRAVVEALRRLPERRRFMKGLFAWVGFRSAVVNYVRPPRSGGRSKFSMWKLWNFALEGITSFSTLPLRLWLYVGSIIAMAAFAYMTYIILRTLILGIDVPGYASILVAMLFFGGVQLIGIGVIGEYLGRVYLETKQRPNYIIRRRYMSAPQGAEAMDKAHTDSQVLGQLRDL